uniref:Photosystem I reaction center subunit II n=1 Tax=Laurencia obtusa TaxID=137763 RepID=UPI0028D3310D|nr:Photosystem I reaction center subunit II [Laurencia obtusa]WMP12932.1 Photosystem I reaction center subunit II [Laurencia obtusa]
MSNTIDFKMPSPTFGGSTGGWLRSAEVEEKYAITWNSKSKSIFEMPTGGSAVMAEGDNLLYLAKKEQCLALGSQLKNKFKTTNFKIYRIFPNGEVQYLHPKDGVFPEKSNEGRIGIGNIAHSIGKNDNPVNKKFTGQATYE